jgi:hypothetical protein
MSEITIPKQLADASWSLDIDGLRIWELNDDGKLLITVGHVDKDRFARACDTYAARVWGDGDTWGDGLIASYEGGFAELIDHVTHRRAQIVDPPKGRYFDFEVEFTENENGIPLTVWQAS